MTLMSNELVLINVIKLNLGMGNTIGHISAPFIMNVNFNHKFQEENVCKIFPICVGPTKIKETVKRCLVQEVIISNIQIYKVKLVKK
jgi:hypothetical protein